MPQAKALRSRGSLPITLSHLTKACAAAHAGWTGGYICDFFSCWLARFLLLHQPTTASAQTVWNMTTEAPLHAKDADFAAFFAHKSMVHSIWRVL
jgi:hypothetical protein